MKVEIEENSPFNQDKNEKKDVHWYYRRRYRIALLVFVGYNIVYMLRNNLNLVIISMTESYNKTLENGTQIEVRDFNWNSIQKGYILSSYFYGYISTIFLGGWMATYFGPRWVMTCALGIPSLVTLATPYLAETGIYTLIIIRAIEGALTGPVFPSYGMLWAKWAPANERSRLLCLTIMGTETGTMIMMFLGALVSKHIGWQWNFYFPGVLGMIWALYWLITFRNSPEEDLFINEIERAFLEKNTEKFEHKKIRHPWKSYFTSLPVLATFISLFMFYASFLIIVVELPTFLRDILKFDALNSGFISSIPFIIMIFSSILSSTITDNIITRKIFSLTKVRKMGIFFSLFGTSLFLFILLFINDPIGIIICICIIMAFNSSYKGSGFANWIDIAPQHSSVLYGLASTFSISTAIFGPIIVGYVVTDKLLSQWRYIFSFLAAGNLFAACFALKFISGKIQPWALNEKN